MDFPLYIFIPVAVGLSAQLLKFFVKFFTKREIELSYINSYGGFPSAHTAFTSSLATIAYLVEGVNSLSFAIASVFMIITVRDAIGIRMFLSQHSKLLNLIVAEMPHKKGKPFYPPLEEQLGHKISEVIGGALVGVLLTLLIYAAFVD